MSERLYNDLNSFLKGKFGEKVYKVSIDGGFACPNLDGKISSSGCIFCNNESIMPPWHKSDEDVVEQLERGIGYVKRRHGANKFIAYLQPYSNTYGDLDKLRKVYELLLAHKDVIGLAISTRPDCVDDEMLDYIKNIKERKYVWLELGLQSVFDKTLQRINRGHSFKDFLRAFEKASQKGILVCVHVVFGLPGETREMMLETAKTLSNLGIFGIKIHSLHILKKTKLYDEFVNGKIEIMSLDSYVNLVADSLEIMGWNIVIHRLTGEGPRSLTVAPEWVFNKLGVINAIKKELERRGSYQGKRSGINS